ncbi:hypothetical protein [Vulcanisaeta thermophila]|uniref:hypothetical protein n=1 Tax=Vulcanisaeta thermophila TaxID=867917 RepID=UPI0008535C64|nr:hypothetical protein [Vulcanisaeta thermophila]
MVRFLIGFLGRSTTWNLIKGITFPEHVGLVYLNSPVDCSAVDLVLVEEYMASLVRGCGNVHVLTQPTIMDVINALLKGLGDSNVSLGIDLGTSRCGISILINETPVVHTVVSRSEIIKLIKGVSSGRRVTIIVGSSPGVAKMVRELIDELDDNVKIWVVDEKEASRRRPWFKSRYPYLTRDELDSLVYVLLSKQWVSAV